MGKRNYKVAVIGAGMITNAAHMVAFRYLGDPYDVVAIADMREDAARVTADKFGIPNVYTDAKKMLDEQNPDIVVVATSNVSHKEYSMMAMKHGSHVICEKPVALKYADAVELFEEAEKQGVEFFPAQTCRWYVEHMAARKLIQEGALGDVYYADFEVIRRRGVPKWGFFHMQEYNAGGPFCDLAVHEIDFMMWALGNPKVKTVSGNTWRKIATTDTLQADPANSGAFGGMQTVVRPYDPKEFSVEDMATGLMRFEGGLTINMKASWAVNLKDSWRRQYAGTKAGVTYGHGPKLTIVGDQNGWQTDITPQIFDENGYPSYVTFPGHIGMYKNIAAYFRGEEDRVVKKEETLNVTAAIEAFYTSAELGREIDCDTIRNGK